VVDGLERDLAGRAVVVRVDIQSEAGAALAARYGIESVPAFLAFDRDGRELVRARGRSGVAELERAHREAAR
jgi:thioredoxin-like negative regulator of GroEL